MNTTFDEFAYTRPDLEDLKARYSAVIDALVNARDFGFFKFI